MRRLLSAIYWNAGKRIQKNNYGERSLLLSDKRLLFVILNDYLTVRYGILQAVEFENTITKQKIERGETSEAA